MEARWSGEWHVVDGAGRSVESHRTEEAATNAAGWCNEHEILRGRLADYRVERHSVDWRGQRKAQ